MTDPVQARVPEDRVRFLVRRLRPGTEPAGGDCRIAPRSHPVLRLRGEVSWQASR